MHRFKEFLKRRSSKRIEFQRIACLLKPQEQGKWLIIRCKVEENCKKCPCKNQRPEHSEYGSFNRHFTINKVRLNFEKEGNTPQTLLCTEQDMMISWHAEAQTPKRSAAARKALQQTKSQCKCESNARLHIFCKERTRQNLSVVPTGSTSMEPYASDPSVNGHKSTRQS